MNEGFSPEYIPHQYDPDRKVRQVTHRDYDTYMFAFNLPEDSLSKAKTVVDVGAGFASFSEEARQKFPGLRTIAIDPVYSSMKSLDLTADELEEKESVLLDFTSSYRGKENSDDLDEYYREKAETYNHFSKEMNEHRNDYLAESHQRLPLASKSANLVLASNSIIRTENESSIIEKALQECLRITKDDGEIRVAGQIGCFEVNDSTGNIELWYHSTLKPNSPQSKELKEKGYYSDPDLMKVFTELEKSGAKFHGVIVHGIDRYGNAVSRFDTLILRKDDKKPQIDLQLGKERVELRKLNFQKSDGFNIPYEDEKLSN